MIFNWVKKISCFFLVIIISSSISAKNFTQELWNENYPFYQKILNLPFNQKLLHSSLEETKFKDYIIQDYLFLQNYRKVYGLLLVKAVDEESARLISKSILAIDEEINNVHKKFFKEFNITENDLRKIAPFPSTEFYNSFLIKTAVLEPFAVGLIATLPCHWIYYQIGHDMRNMRGSINNKYQAWIDEYGNIPWEKSDTKIFVDLIERYMQLATPLNREKMRQAYITAMKLEYMFWDGVYNQIKWPS